MNALIIEDEKLVAQELPASSTDLDISRDKAPSFRK